MRVCSSRANDYCGIPCAHVLLIYSDFFRPLSLCYFPKEPPSKWARHLHSGIQPLGSKGPSKCGAAQTSLKPHVESKGAARKGHGYRQQWSNAIRTVPLSRTLRWSVWSRQLLCRNAWRLFLRIRARAPVLRAATFFIGQPLKRRVRRCRCSEKALPSFSCQPQTTHTCWLRMVRNTCSLCL